jgi:acyl-CoA synthetase (NDP forming)
MAAVIIQPMVTGGTEVTVGVTQEPVFGPLIVFGLGGVATDVPGDRSELELDPVIARADGAHAVDARVRVLPTDPYLRRLR